MTMSIIEPNTLGDGTFTRATIGTFIGSDGLLQTAAIDVPRLQYNPADLTAPPTLLVEAAGTNLIFKSEADSGWVALGTTPPTVNSTNTTVDGVVCTSTTFPVTTGGTYGSGRVTGTTSTGSVNAGVTINQSSWIKISRALVGAEQITFYITGTFGGSNFILTATNSSQYLAWARAQGAALSPTLTGADFFVIFATTLTSPITVFSSRRQIETGTVATSYIATTTAAVTRAADIVSTTGLIYCSVPETDFAVWSAPTNYSLGNKVIRPSTHRIYQRLIAGTTATAPELDTTNWQDIAPTNRWAMHDKVVGTLTTATAAITTVMRPGSVSGLALLELVGKTATVVMKDAPGGSTVYKKVVSLDATLITGFYDWMYKPYEQLTDLVLTDLPSQFVSNELTVSVASTSAVSIGVCKFGGVTSVGLTQYGASASITDYSKKDVDAFGNVIVTKRGFSKRADFSVITVPADFAGLFRKLTTLRATPCIYIGTEVAGYEPFIVYGFYKDFSIVVPYPTQHLCNISIEGLV